MGFYMKGGIVMSMRNFAEHVVSVSNDHIGGITNLELQKVMYFVIGEYIKNNGIDELIEEIYDEPFEAWPYGPVVRSEYFRNRAFGRYNITREASLQPNYTPLDNLIRTFSEKEVTELVDKSHQHSKWLLNREDILKHCKVTYTLEDIEYDFTH